MADATTFVGQLYNINHYAGDTLPITINVKDNNNQPIDITQYDFTMQIKHRLKYNELPRITLTIGNGLYYGGNNNQLIVKYVHPLLKGGDYVYDLEVTLPDLTIQTWLYGSISFMQDVTNSIDES